MSSSPTAVSIGQAKGQHDSKPIHIVLEKVSGEGKDTKLRITLKRIETKIIENERDGLSQFSFVYRTKSDEYFKGIGRGGMLKGRCGP